MNFNIFIGYNTEESVDKEWVLKFSDTIKLLMSKVFIKEVEIVTSDSLIKDDKYSKKTLIEVFSNIDVFFIIMSKNTLESTVIKQELESIMLIAMGDRNKVFKILIDDISEKKQTKELRELLPIIFYEKNNNKIAPIDIAKAENNQNYGDYWVKLIDLVYNLCETEIFSGSKKTIYLAYAGEDQEQIREIIKRELVHYGHTVLPSKLLVENKSVFEKEVILGLEQSDLSIHIFGSEEGSKIDEKRCVAFQNEIASEYCSITQNKLNRLIWISPDIIFKNDIQRINIEKLKRDSKLLIGAELLQTPIEDFKTLMHKRLKSISTKKEISTEELILVYLISTDNNSDLVKNVSAFLNKNNINTIVFKSVNDKHGLLRNHRDDLTKCDGVIIFADGNNDHWVESMQKDTIKSIGFGRKEPILIQSIYNIKNKEIVNSFIDQFNLIDGSEGFNDKLLRPFVDEIKLLKESENIEI